VGSHGNHYFRPVKLAFYLIPPSFQVQGPVFLGRATRAVEFAAEGDKEYIAGLRLGVTTNTQDMTGEILTEQPVNVTQAQLEEVLPAFQGDILQIPPMYSAIKIQGKKLY